MRPGPLVLLLIVHAVVVLGGVALMLKEFGERAEQELDDEATRIEERFERDAERLEDDVISRLREELDRRLPVAP